MKIRISAVFTVIALLSILIGQLNITSTALAATPPSTGAYTSGVYRNLFKEAGYTDSQIQAKIDTAWNQIFYGNNQQKIYYTVGTDMAYMKDIADNDVRTEGQSYGMMIALQTNHQAEFNKIWKWTKTYMQHTDPASPWYGYFAWHATTAGVKIDANNAADGEIWLATALFLADGRWGSGTGIYNYKAEGQFILDQIRNKEATSATTGVYDLFNPANSLTRFVAADTGTQMHTWTDPSYMEPAFLDYWAKVASHDNAFWTGAATAARNFLHTTIHPTTGLMPDYANFDGTPHYCCPTGAGNHHYYGWDARRTQMNIAMDYHWWAKDSWQIEQTDRLQNFFFNQGVTTHGAEYQLDGTMITNYHESGHVAMNAAAGLAGSNSRVNDFVNHLYTVSIPTGQYRYYDGLLYMLGLLQTSGNFRIYGGGAATPPPPTATPTAGGPTATPTATPAPSTKLHVGAISVTILNGSRGPQGKVQVTVKDNNGATVSGANVSGVWSGGATDSDSGNTNQSGVFSAFSNFGASGATFTFCVNNITKNGYTYNPSANTATCASATAP